MASERQPPGFSMANQELGLVGIGNAIVDVLARADEDFLVRHDLAKGAMTLIDDARADEVYAAMGPGIEVSGGSAANTMVGFAALRGDGAFIGKVREDQLGAVFAHDLRAAGVRFATPLAVDGPATARCLIVVTPDAQRTMNTYLGACVGLGPDDVDEDAVSAAKVTYLEGYLWDPPSAKEAFRKAIAVAHGAGREVALTLSDAFCVDRYREEFLQLAEAEVDVLFANQAEIASLYELPSFDAALQRARGRRGVTVLTRGAAGSVVVSADEKHVIDAEPVAEAVDTTGAGDLYAAGFLYGYTQGLGLYEAGRLGSIAASEVIGHFGARPEAELHELAARGLGRAI